MNDRGNRYIVSRLITRYKTNTTAIVLAQGYIFINPLSRGQLVRTIKKPFKFEIVDKNVKESKDIDLTRRTY